MADMVRAVVQTGPRQMEMREYPRPVLGPVTGAVLRVEACGICGSDVEQYKGAMGTRGLPMIPGHEPLGIIEEITDETAARWGVQAGMRVAVEILIPCRSCNRCLAGNYMNCRNRIGSHGGAQIFDSGCDSDAELPAGGRSRFDVDAGVNGERPGFGPVAGGVGGEFAGRFQRLLR